MQALQGEHAQELAAAQSELEQLAEALYGIRELAQQQLADIDKGLSQITEQLS
jgi:hypothetical protein